VRAGSIDFTSVEIDHNSYSKLLTK